MAGGSSLQCVWGLLTMEKLSYKLENFEGPLDLLLFLIAKKKLQIIEISISELVDQYLEQMDAMREQDMDISSEFVEMAARLVYIKTVSLLPKHEEAEELKKELEGQLLEYQECKRVAAQLSQMISFDAFTRKPAEIEPDRRYKRKHTCEELLEAYRNAVGRGRKLPPPTPENFSGIVSHRIVSVASQIVSVLRKLWKRRAVPYESLFEEKKERSELVATFLAILELIKGKRIRVDEEGKTPVVKMAKERR